MLNVNQVVKSADDDAFMASLLGEVDSNAPVRRVSPATRTVKSENRNKIRVLSPPLSHHKPKRSQRPVTDDAYLSDTPPTATRFNDDEDEPMRIAEDDDVLPSDQPMPSSPITKALERKAHVKQEEAEEFDDLMEVAEAVGQSTLPETNVNKSASRNVPQVKKNVYPSPGSSSPTRVPVEAIDASSWNNVTTKLNVLSSSPATESGPSYGKVQAEDVLEPDGSLRMFWMDYTEVNGSLCLFGKVENKRSKRHVSCFVKVDNILRKLYFLPREHRQRKSSWGCPDNSLRSA